MVNMLDVARHAGVSGKTVSRVINNEPKVKDSVRQRVRESITELGYVPSASARALRARRSYRVHFLTNKSQNNFANNILFGALQTCHKRGYQLVIDLITDQHQIDEVYLSKWIDRIVVSGKPDGIILMPPLALNTKFIGRLIEHGISVVGIGATHVHKNQFSVLINDEAAAYDMVTYLISLGHRRIGVVLGVDEQSATHDRLNGYKRALVDNNISFDDRLIRPGEFSFESGMLAGEDLLKLNQPPTAIFALNDDMAAGVMFSAQKLNMSIPADLSLAGFDDNEFAKSLWPRLTTIHQPLEKFGEEAVNIIISESSAKGDAKAGDNLMLDYQLIKGHSAAPITED